MKPQYLSDRNGKQTAIVIPIKDWELITHKHQDLKYLTEENELAKVKTKLSTILDGCISKKTADTLHNELKQMRNEWERDTY